jgi:hypothetical protein
MSAKKIKGKQCIWQMIGLGFLVVTFVLGMASIAPADSPELLQSLNAREDLRLSRSEPNWSYCDKVAFANFVNLFHADITQTVTKHSSPGKLYRGMTWTEENPILHPIADNSELLSIYHIFLSSFLGKRWAEMENPTQRTVEIIGANLVEVHVLNYSRESWRLAFGCDF